MNNMKRSMRRVFWLLFALFILLSINLGSLLTFQRQKIATNSYNPRLQLSDPSIVRGEIYDINGNVLAKSVLKDDKYVREYPYGFASAHVTGYVGDAMSGTEAVYNFTLQKVHFENFARIGALFNKEPIKGNNIHLSVDMDIQELADELIGTQKGAIAVMEPSTGRIIAMTSFPTYNPNTIADKWKELNENPDSPLINRASQGLYAPGSTFKIVTGLSGLRNLSDIEGFSVNCSGKTTLGEKVIHCFDNTAHGEVDFDKAMAQSCNVYFTELAGKIGADALRKTADDMLFNTAIDFELPISRQSFALDKSSNLNELAETSIGQGKTLATPLYMCMLAGAVANDGIMMKPYIVDHISYASGKAAKRNVPKTIERIMSVDEANRLTKAMVEVINNGTGSAAKLSNVQSAGKTGTAENDAGNSHSLFIGFAPAENPVVAVAVVLENPLPGRKATPIAKKLMEAVIKKNIENKEEQINTTEGKTKVNF